MSIGRQLMQKAILFARRTGARGIALETSHGNLTAQALYESLGFQRDENYYHYYLTV
ncbi:GNAT family N-acetyltransferase [Photobacterium sp. WH24]|uniref:GNAT family N-acetyltransferase n=1 Tax=Photobacterium sp. WH24 TaxID=2827237 RepID=UPI001C437D60|nr:GNAT family N-acetyltransferase [Photobacterium sp. WH24]MBV7260853.1 GNAT family N-acetyltransferase [Photobacterium sp. WH24]